MYCIRYRKSKPFVLHYAYVCDGSGGDGVVGLEWQQYLRQDTSFLKLYVASVCY